MSTKDMGKRKGRAGTGSGSVGADRGGRPWGKRAKAWGA